MVTSVPVSSLLEIGLEVFTIKESTFFIFFKLPRWCGLAVKSMDSQVPSLTYKSFQTPFQLAVFQFRPVLNEIILASIS